MLAPKPHLPAIPPGRRGRPSTTQPTHKPNLTALILLGIVSLAVLHHFRKRLLSAEAQAKLRRPLLWLGLLAVALLSTRLGWAAPLLGAAAAAAIRLAPALRHRAGQEGSSPPTSGGRMSRQEAYEILGLAPGASREEVVAAHRRLMQKMHPDRGGSDYLAGKINQARETLLNR
jgi:hypothetical protein